MSIPRIILDTDGGYDDAWALLMLLKAHSQRRIQLEAIVCGSGNAHVDHVLINMCRVLQVADKKDIPVFRGAPDPILPFEHRSHDNFNGKDGFGDIYPVTDLPDMSPVNVTEHGVNAMARIVKENPGKVIVFAIGALTNLALAIRMYPEIVQQLQSVTIMGGNFVGIGNVTPSAEFNIFFDPEAADIVLKTLKCPMTFIPWETCIPPRNPVNWNWRKSVLGVKKHPILDLLNPVEESNYKELPPTHQWACADCVAAAVLLAPDQIVKTFQEVYTAVELTGSLTRGQFVLDPRSQKPPNAKIITEIHPEVYKKAIFWILDSQEISLIDYLKA
ncbi:nucleoside hydrolase-like [Phlebotomus argentipes]|uniref:nucleoside hydrolase-like n=1 Tax=Phlebotomus argentipes TaxID=94469 RepID=UPI002892A054|nr:nucleoside hydrolase-like [Phlebotomus argentipes]